MNLFELQAAYNAGTINKHQYIDEMHGLHSQLFDYAEFFKTTDIARIEISDGKVILETRDAGIKILCDKADKRIAPMEILNFGPYEKDDSDLIFRLLENHMSIFDIGANIGWYSLNFAKAFPNATIYAFEPIPATYGYLQANIGLNGSTQIQAHNFGFSDHDGELTFYFDPNGSGGASSVDLQGKGVVQKLVCKIERLDAFVEKTDARVDFIKCDVEGAELFMFSGGIETLKKFKPIIFTEMLRKWAAKFNYHPNQIIELLSGLGYRCFVGREGKLVAFQSMDENTLETNFFFLHPDAHAAKIQALT
jgi:FkbM family methyltransferase